MKSKSSHRAVKCSVSVLLYDVSGLILLLFKTVLIFTPLYTFG